MPKILLTVPETNISTTRPVVLDIVRQLLKDTGISPKTTIFFPGDHERGAQPHSLISEMDESNMFPFNERVTIEVDDNFEQDRILSAAVFRPENLFIFRDDRIEVGIKPAYSSSDITINFKYRAKDKTSATRWRDDMRMRIGMMKDERLHTVAYHYLVPQEFFVILKELHRMREAVAGYGEDYDTYLKANMTQRASLLTNLAGTQGQWGISESQTRIVGYFDFDGVPELGSKEDEGDTWTISVAYKFKFDKPVACVMFYPLMIHNQVVGEGFRSTNSVDTPEQHVRSASLSVDAFSNFEKGRTHTGPVQGVAIPPFDDFIPSSVPSKTFRIVSLLTNVDVANPSLLMNFNDMGGDMDLHPILMAFMAKEAPYMTKKYQSVLQVNLYRNADLLPYNALSVSSSLDVTTDLPLSLRDYYHVRLSVVDDWRLLPMSALNRLRENGLAAQLLMYYLAPWMDEEDKLPAILAGDYIAKSDLDNAIDHLNRGLLSMGNHQTYQFNTVGTLFVQTSKGSM